MHTRGARIGDDLLDFGEGKVATRFKRFSWLVIDDPVADACLDASEILIGKLVAFGRAVFVNRVGPVNENAKRHDRISPSNAAILAPETDLRQAPQGRVVGEA